MNTIWKKFVPLIIYIPNVHYSFCWLHQRFYLGKGHVKGLKEYQMNDHNNNYSDYADNKSQLKIANLDKIAECYFWT